MTSTTNSSFCLYKPENRYWNAVTYDVVEVVPVSAGEADQYSHQKTDEFIRDFFKIISPPTYAGCFTKKCSWLECSGPARSLKFKEYVELYHSLRPDFPLPPGWKEKRAKL